MGYGPEKIRPYNNNERKVSQISHMFDNIASTYDRLNHLLSLGLDVGWRKKAIAFLRPYYPKQILDIATGTGDLAITMVQELSAERIVGADISEGMIDIGRMKVKEAGLQELIFFDKQDCCALTYPQHSFDAVTAAFGVRNFENIEEGIKGMYRVLKPGGHILILELTTPTHFPMKQLYRIYSKVVIPNVGRWFSKENAAYKYLPESIKTVPQGRVMVELLQKIGFTEIQVKTFTFGICSLYIGLRE